MWDLESTLLNRTQNFNQMVEAEREKAVWDFKDSQEFQDLQAEYGSGSYRSGFKLCRWQVRKKFSGLNLDGITMKGLSLETADQAEEEEPDSPEDEADP